MKKGILLTSVLGMNLKNISIKDKENQELKCTNLKTTTPDVTDTLPKIGTSQGGNLWFDNWNQALIDKISNCKNQLVNSY